MTRESRFDSVGWIFFGVTWLIALYPTYLLVSGAFLDTTPLQMVVGATAFIAAIGTAIFTWIVNTALGYIVDQRSTEKNTDSRE